MCLLQGWKKGDTMFPPVLLGLCQLREDHAQARQLLIQGGGKAGGAERIHSSTGRRRGAQPDPDEIGGPLSDLQIM